eukprot:scaffold8330_cov108-Skeletonema_dohrnii-CCMP3373.AAC.5
MPYCDTMEARGCHHLLGAGTSMPWFWCMFCERNDRAFEWDASILGILNTKAESNASIDCA